MFRAIFHTFCGKSTFFLVSFTLFLGITGSVQATEKSTLSASFTEQIDTHFTTAVDFLAGQLFSDFGTGIPLIVMWLIIGAVFFTLRMGFINLRGFRHALAVTQGAYDVPADKGEVTHFQALTSALSATVGLGNIAGVTIAVSTGGPGAVFWMLVEGFFGMSSKFVECTLAQMYRRVNQDGSVTGAPWCN